MDVRKILFAVTQFFFSLFQLTVKWEMERLVRRRKAMLFWQRLNAETAAYMNSNRMVMKRRQRRYWVKQRSQDWWERIVLQTFTEEDWLSNFRMSSATFKLICDRLEPHLRASEFCVRRPTSVEKKVAIALYKLASCAEYRMVANQFGTHKSVVHNYLKDVCDAIYVEFKDEYLSLPNEVEAMEIADGFESICGIPNVIGAIDGTHIPILPPTVGYRDFVNRKGWPSYNVMAVVDHMYRFRYATCRHVGSTHDASVLKDSNLYRLCDRMLPNISRTIEETDIPYVLLGDPAYPLLPWLMKGYKGNVDPEEESFNVYLNRGRVVVENAFGRLKARFRCLSKRLDMQYTSVPPVVIACLILHNIIETRKDTFQQSWVEAIQQAEVQFPQPHCAVARDFDDLDASRIRDTLKNYMLSYPLRRSQLH